MVIREVCGGTRGFQDSWAIGSRRLGIRGWMVCPDGLGEPKEGSCQGGQDSGSEQGLDLPGARVPGVERQV